MSEHTEGPLCIGPMESGGYISDAKGCLVASCYHIHGSTKMPAIANARRLVAAWNACAGIPTEELEAQSERLRKEIGR